MVSAGLHTAAAGMPGIPRPAGLGMFRPHLPVSSAVQALAWRVLEHMGMLHKEAKSERAVALCGLCQHCQPLQLSAEAMRPSMLYSCIRHGV